MRKKSKRVQEGRREFLKGVAVVGGAATLATISKSAAARVETKEVGSAPKQSKGYHETPHIRAYYETARQ